LFTGGLPDPIRTDVELQAPADLQRAMSLARAYERRASSLEFTSSKPPRPPQQTPNLSQPQQPVSTAAPLAITAAQSAPSRPFCRLSPQEMAERRRQGLCYNCDEPYVQGHRCQRLFYLEVSDFDESEELDPEKDPENSELPPLISLHAITGIRPEETMQLRVNIGNHELTALLDSGSTHNFVSMEAARHIGLSIHDSKGKNVVIANGDRVACRGLARDVALCIAGSFFTVDSYTIPLDCYDMVLGVQFLRTLGSILWDFDDLCMAFWHHGQRILWKGIGSMRWDIKPTGRLHSISSESLPVEVSDFDESVQSHEKEDNSANDLPPLLSLHAITGIRTTDTMQIKVGIGNHQFTALLDSGSTHNFISGPAAQHVGLCFHDSRGAYVTVANGHRVPCRGLAKDVALRIGVEYFTVDYYTIPLHCYDMVLGVSFLRTLGSILWDFDDLCMAFWHQGRRVLWKGIDSTRWDIPSTDRLLWHIRVQWNGLSNAESTWKPVNDFRTSLPDFQLEDELFPEGGRDVMVGRVHERRRRG